MEVNVSNTTEETNVWGGGNKPLNASYGKMMMWFFIVSDALTFTGFLVAYGFSRFKNIDSWPIADEVFTHFPFLHGIDAPMYYVALMTFILIFSSVTMVLAVDAGHHMNKAKVTFYMLLTIIGGAIFVGSQAWEWKNFIKGEYGALETKGGQILQFVDSETGKRVALADFAVEIDSPRETHQESNGIWFVGETTLPSYSLEEVTTGFKSHANLAIKSEKIDESGHKIILSREESLLQLEGAINVVEGANLIHNEYGNRLFADFFFFITGFHGFHVLSGVVINIIIFFNVIMGTYEKRGHYEMVEKVGLYWHFVDLVWVFVFTFFYLV
ncbi:cytochrome c oxidase subunit 3 [Flavobacteriaceae bacterium]|jgi:cytochrome c oxidase subunit 3|uniref:cytochrome c oxidase subunit 3 n=1 Tax=Candidatus Arcticimaribacter forsetii TaxID=2820661 RepID=UPI0020772C75|nr:cytochrome c oxidase subunit 3 [Candidatus Arcticimaribacter forsetii]MCH1539763.1 cytochrome c oxidase subunit 3 [Flavobacteriaceae bacterium]MDB2325662.1 cytochrome c oxidase subunit 3 [Flavobacteriaceae bacterium]MDB2329679.1 cytochrome c oxidase subunit 3 [Flavobacteriaceae bacterium]MDB4609017.1 cytochrome c oxidase subunit 3 [Flavobacteriaceae bacterium]MDB4620943.1 cytochrome c oxidase subunit 3 [Flavobacteriaceae bacterium]